MRHRMQCLVKNFQLRFHAVTYALCIAVVWGSALLLFACVVEKPDFSAYVDTNLIPDNGFDSFAWIPDEDSDADNAGLGDGLADARAADASGYGNFDGTYLGMTRVDTLAHGLVTGTHYTQAQSGFADAAALYAGLSADALLNDGSMPPVYRLEVKNLFRNGDFEGTTNNSGYTLFDLGANTSNASFLTGADPYNLRTGQVAIVNLDSVDYLQLDLQDIVAGFTDSATANKSDTYNLSMWFYTKVTNFFGIWSPANIKQLFTFAYIDPTAIDPDDTSSPRYGYWTQFPVAVKPGTETSVFSAQTGDRYFCLNLGDGTDPNQPIRLADLALDDIQVVKYNLGLGLRLKVPYKLFAADGTTEIRPELMGGGTYTIKFEVRIDPTVTDNQTKRPNSFSASYLSVLVQNHGTNQTSTENPTQANLLQAKDASAAGYVDWNSGWATVSLDYTDLIGDVNLETTEDDATLLEIYLSPCNVTNNNLLTPGTLLLTAPRLYWSPDADTD